MVSNRESNGRFKPGHKALPGGGRPKRATEAAYLEAMNAAVSVKDWQDATKAMLAAAKKGDATAYNTLAKYLAGQPVQKLQLSPMESALLGDMVEALKAAGMQPSTVFERMILKAAEMKKASEETK